MLRDILKMNSALASIRNTHQEAWFHFSIFVLLLHLAIQGHPPQKSTQQDQPKYEESLKGDDDEVMDLKRSPFFYRNPPFVTPIWVPEIFPSLLKPRRNVFIAFQICEIVKMEDFLSPKERGPPRGIIIHPFCLRKGYSK